MIYTSQCQFIKTIFIFIVKFHIFITIPIKISQLPNLIINQINSSDLIPIVNSNATKKVTLGDLSKKILGGLQFTSSLSGNTNINIGSTNAMTINTSGSIGIGTSDPQAKLEVQGNILIGRADNNYEGGQLSLARSYDNKPDWHIDVFGNTDSPNLRILTKGSELVTILPSGNVGIGTYTPQAKLEVVVNDGYTHGFMARRYSSVNEGGTIRLSHARGTISAPTSVVFDDVLGAVVGSGYGSTQWTVTASSRIDFAAEENFTDSSHGSNIRFITTQNGTSSDTRQERMRITNSGNVGIGTNTPQAKLHVNGLSDFDGTPSAATSKAATIAVIDARHSSQAGGTIEFGANGSTHCAIKGTLNHGGEFTTGEMRFYNRAAIGTSAMAEVMLINNLGEVGIGTNLPGYKLHVNGTVAGTSAYINLSDKREKENIDYSFQHGLSDILLLKPAKFDYINGEKDHLGFIAQDVKEIIPEIIGSFQKDVNGEKQERLTIKESSIIPILVKAIQELTERLEKLESKKSKSKK